MKYINQYYTSFVSGSNPPPECMGQQPSSVAEEMEFLRTFMSLDEKERQLRRLRMHAREVKRITIGDGYESSDTEESKPEETSSDFETDSHDHSHDHSHIME